MYQGPLVFEPDRYNLGRVGDEAYHHYCARHPVTLMLKSAAGHPLVLGCQEAAEDWFVLEGGGAFASTCVEAESSKRLVGPVKCESLAHERLRAFGLDLISKQHVFEIKDCFVWSAIRLLRA